MEANRFDSLTKRLATRASRRSALRGLAGGALAAAGLATSSSAAPRGKVTICHWDDDRGVFEQLSINENGLNGHRRHARDILNPDFTANETCGDCTTSCTASAGTCGIGTCSAEGCCSYEPDDSLCPGDCQTCVQANLGNYDCAPLPYGADCGKCHICDGAGACITAVDETNPNVSCRDDEAGEFCCAGDCTNTGLDELNCGFCGNVCDPGLTCCRGSCIDTDTHQEHCGDCEQLCFPGTCSGGTCSTSAP
jgi:hypothetical protein